MRECNNRNDLLRQSVIRRSLYASLKDDVAC
jgi:hypothetical protein